MPATTTKEGDELMIAAVALLGSTGASEVSIRYCDEQVPTVWFAIAKWGKTWAASGAMHPLLAVLKLCDDVIDGGECTHCGRPTGFSPEHDQMPLDNLVCWYQYDPELKEFRRGCAGSVP